MLAAAWMVGCGAEVGGADGGQLDAGSDAGSVADGGRRCERHSDCDNGVYCDGQETCVDASCQPGRPPCEAGDDCVESERRCESAACLGSLSDRDGDSHLSSLCGGDDCDDDDPNRYPGNPEICDAEGHDEDCNETTIGWRDADGDGYVDRECRNTTSEGAVNRGDDCDDGDAAVNPGVPEVCNGNDDDCDGSIDEDLLVDGYADGDGDGWGADDMPVSACPGTPGFAPDAGDCDDADVAVFPGAPELCDGRDNDCDGTVDETPAGTLYYRDRDADGYGDPATSMRTCATPPAGWTGTAGDCWDSSRSGATLVRPGSDWQSTPFCRDGALCGGGCCLTLTPICSDCSGSAEWDYNCSGTVETERRGDDLCDEATTASACAAASSATVTPGFVDPRVADCGRPIPYITSCVWTITTGRCGHATENRILRCR